jgi:hypothetical protein
MRGSIRKQLKICCQPTKIESVVGKNLIIDSISKKKDLVFTVLKENLDI